MKDTLNKITLIFSVVLGVFTAITKTQDFLLSVYWAPEILLTLCVLGIIVFAARLIWAKRRKPGFPGFTLVPRFSQKARLLGWVALVGVPLVAILVWYSMFRIPPATKKEIADLETAGDVSANTNQPRKAMEFYQRALTKDPRRTDIRSKYEKLQNQVGGGK